MLVVAVLACCALLASPVSVPIGPMYWDVVVYLDGGSRVLAGQIPSVDFFAPVGPLEYWLFAAGLAIFPQGQPVLLSQWMLFAVTAPPLVIVLHGVQRRSPALAFALLAPFLLFQLAPINVEHHSSFPGADGYGIYNRHVTEVLYVLVAAFLFERRQARLAMVAAWCCIALFLLKITGFVSAGLLCAIALAAGRITVRAALAVALAFLAAMLGLEAASGVVSHYVADIARLVALNEGSLLPRFVQAASIHFGVLGTGALLLAALLLLRPEGTGRAHRPNRREALRGLADTNAVWLGGALFAGLFFETQNTGGQAFVFLIPILVRIVCEANRASAAGAATILVLAAATGLPPMVTVFHKSARALIGPVNYVPVAGPALGTLSRSTQRPEVVAMADDLLVNYWTHREAYEAFARDGLLPSYTLYSGLDFQAAWLKSVEEAVGAVGAFESANGVRFETIMSLNFVNPFPYLLDRDATRRIAIGADPFRAVPLPDAETVEAVRGTDLVLYPTCPVTVANQRLREIYAGGLANHREIALSPCWTAYVREGLLASP